MKNKILRLFVLFALSAGLSVAYAERVSQEDAAIVAGNFLSAGDTASSQGAQAPARSGKIRRVAMAEEAQYYVYENANGEGWVMVAANDVVQPILAYSREGVFNAETQPSNVKTWMKGYNKQIKYAEENNLEATEEVAAKWKMLRKAPPVTAMGTVVVAPLIKTTWDQDSPYWNNCPKSGSTSCYTGCVATAMAQVMNYWQWPVTGTGSYSYTSSTNKLSCSADFSSTTYDWANMVDHYTKYYSGSSQVSVSSTTTAQKNAVATLMYHCGVAVEMDYGTSSQGGSSAYTIYPNSSYTTTRCAAYALINNFGYNKSTLKCYYRSGGYGYSSVSDANWLNYLKTELDAKRPIMYAGADDEGGHSFICDGYDDQNYFHFNWGWSGYCDGYYTVNNMVPGTGGSGSGNGSYNDGQDIIIGIQPPVTGHQVVTEGTGCTITPSLARVENGKQLTATIEPTDATYDFTSITVKLGTTTLTKNTHYTLSSDNKTLTVKAAAITGSTDNNLTITCVWTKNRYSYSLLGTNCTEELEGMLSKNAALSLTITPDAGYTLADAACWTVEMGGSALYYGTGFTYNSSTNTFSISKVTGDVVILAEAGRQITWRANGSVHATNLTANDKIILPTDPDDCESGKKFVGWCTSSNYSNATTAPTFAKEGDSYSVATYYAVYATASGSGASTQTTYTFTGKSWADSQSAWTSDKDGNGYTANQGVQVTTGTTGAGATTNVSQSGVTKVVVNYCTNSTKGAGSIKVTVGSTSQTKDVTVTGGTTLRNLEYDFSNVTGKVSIAVTCNTNSIYVNAATITTGGGATYSDYSTACGTPCSNTPTMSFANATVSKTTADASFTQAVTISGKGSGQTVAYSSSNEAVATVNASGAVTIKGIGSTTITASVAANGTYCAASASYTLTVTAAPINVTLYYGGTSATLSNQTNPYTLPTTGTYVAAMCDGDWTFDGWYGSTYAKSTDKPTYITQLTATGSAYAVYKTTETTEGGGGGGSSTESVTFSDRYTTNTSLDKVAIAIGSHATVTFDKGSNNNAPQYYTTGTAIRWYGGGTCVVATDEGKITGITITFGSSDGSNSISANTGTFNGGTWEGEAQSVTFTQSGSSGNRRIAGIAVTISGGGGGTTETTYYSTTPECATPCSNTPTVSFTNETVNKTTTDASFTQTVTITGKGDGQTVAYTSSDETIATVNGSGVVTLKGKVGSTTITASVEASGTYCAASASYTLNVTAAPIDVTLYYGGTSATITGQNNPYTLPTTGTYVADMCDGEWTFDGWYGSAYAKSTEQPEYITQLSATSSAYAVYKTTETSAGVSPRKAEASSASYSFSNKSWQSEDGNWTSGQDGAGYGNQGVQVTKNGTGANATCPNSYNNISSIVVSYCTNSSSGAGSIVMNVNGAEVTQSVTSTGGTSARDLTFDFSSTTPSGAPKITVNCTTNSIYVCGVTIYYGGSGGGTTSTTYYATTPECETPVVCELTGITLNTGSVKTSFTNEESFSYSGLVVTANYSNCTSQTVTPTSVSTPDMSTAGTKTVTITYTEGGVTKTATYQITVTAVVYRTVTWKSCGETIKTDKVKDGSALVLPTAPGANAGKSFAGWTATQHHTGASAPADMFTSAGSKTVTADVTYYAVFK